MVSLGREGYLRYARAIFETAFAMQDAVKAHSELRLIGSPTFCFSFTSDEFDIYHVNDFMRTRGWRFNGQQYPNSIHMAVTRPQTQDGLADTFATDLDEAVALRGRAQGRAGEEQRDLRRRRRRPSADEADAFIEAVMADMMDEQQALPPSPDPIDRGAPAGQGRPVPAADDAVVVLVAEHADRTRVETEHLARAPGRARARTR